MAIEVERVARNSVVKVELFNLRTRLDFMVKLEDWVFHRIGQEVQVRASGLFVEPGAHKFKRGSPTADATASSSQYRMELCVRVGPHPITSYITFP